MTELRAKSLCQTVEDYALAIVGAIYLLLAFAAEKLSLIRGRDRSGGPRWRWGR